MARRNGDRFKCLCDLPETWLLIEEIENSEKSTERGRSIRIDGDQLSNGWYGTAVAVGAVAASPATPFLQELFSVLTVLQRQYAQSLQQQGEAQERQVAEIKAKLTALAERKEIQKKFLNQAAVVNQNAIEKSRIAQGADRAGWWW